MTECNPLTAAARDAKRRKNKKQRHLDRDSNYMLFSLFGIIIIVSSGTKKRIEGIWLR